MTDPLNYYLLKFYETIATEDPHLWLGRIVQKLDSPVPESTPKDASNLRGPVFKDEGLVDVEVLMSSINSHSVRAEVANILGVSAEKSQTHASKLNALEVRKMELRRHTSVVKGLEGNLDVTAGLQHWKPFGEPVYLVVGLLVANRVVYSDPGSSQNYKEKLDAGPDAGLVSAAMGGPGFIQGKVGIGGSKERSSKTIMRQHSLTNAFSPLN